MPAATFGPYVFGIVETKPFALPDGWAWHESREEFLEARDPGGNRYIVKGEELHKITQGDKCLNVEHDSPITFPQ